MPDSRTWSLDTEALGCEQPQWSGDCQIVVTDSGIRFRPPGLSDLDESVGRC